MDNIVYTCIVPLIFGIFFGEIRYCYTLFVSNTKLINRQSDQIQFILSRVIDLDKKIKRLEQELNDLNNNDNSINSFILDTIQEEPSEKELVEKELVAEDLVEEDIKEASFEIIEPVPIKTQQEKGWIRYLF
jgi:predicted transcriptional regulator